MNESEEALTNYMQQMIMLLRQMNKQNSPQWTYLGKEDFLLREGCWYKPQPLPAAYKLGIIQRCFNNSLELALRENELRYVEGIAHAIIPIHHGWCTDGNGNVIEVTLREPATAYIGFEVPIDPIAKALAKGTTLLDDWKCGWPIFRKPFKPYFRKPYGRRV